MLENQIKQEKLNADIRKAKNDANTLAANRAINAKVAMSPSAQALQQSLQNGSIFGEDYLDASPEVISGARTAVGDMLTNSLNQDRVAALEPNRKIAWKRQQYANDPVGYEKAMASMLSPETYNASPETINGIATGLTDAQTFDANKYKQNQLESTDAIKKSVNSVIGFALVGGGSKLDIRNNAFKRAYENNFNGQQLSVLADELKAAGIDIPDPIAQVPAAGGKTGSTPAANAIAGSIPIDNTGTDSGGFKLSRILPKEENRNFAPLVLSRVNGDLTGLSIDDKIKLILPALEFTESRGNPNAVSPTGARGLMQLMPDTARELERKLGMKPGQTDIDPAANKKAGIYYFTELMKKYNGNEEYALAAYNAGPDTVDKAIKQQKDNPIYSDAQVSNVTSRASRAIAQFSADPLVLNYQTLNNSKLTADQVALDGVKTSVDFGSLNKDEMDLAARNIKRTIEYVQKQAGGNISPELAFAIAKQAFGDENFRILWLNSDLNLNTTKMNKIIKSLNDKGGIPDQANELSKMQGVFSKLEAANTNVSTLQQNLIDAKRNNGNNPYSDVVSKAQSALDKALDIRSKIAQEIEKSSIFQPKENVTVEQKLTNNNTIKGGGGSAIGDALAKQRQLDKQSNTTKDNTTTPPTVNNANNFVNSRQGNVSKKLAESLSTTDPAQVKPVETPISIPIKVDGKSGTGTTFALDNKTGQSIPVTPLKLDPNVKYLKPVTVVKADRSGGQKGVITYVGDGDGANVDVGGSTIKCRLDTFDAPETGGSPKKWPDQPYSREAENKLKSLIASGEVTVIVSKPADTNSPPSGKNNYGRSLCKIEVQGKNVDQEMLRSGAAWLRLEYATDEKLINLFNTAKANKVGLFADPNAVPPWDYRKSFK